MRHPTAHLRIHEKIEEINRGTDIGTFINVACPVKIKGVPGRGGGICFYVMVC